MFRSLKLQEEVHEVPVFQDQICCVQNLPVSVELCMACMGDQPTAEQIQPLNEAYNAH